MKVVTNLITLLVLTIFSVAAFSSVSTSKEYKEFKVTMEKKLKKVEVKLNKMGKKISQSTSENKAKMKDNYQELVNYKDKLKMKLADAGDTSQDKWEQVKGNLKDMADDLERKIDRSLK